MDIIDSKKIEEAALSYCAKCSDITNRNVNLDKDGCVDLHNGFIDGAKWAINEFLKDLWHDSKKEPEDNRNILIEHKCGNLCPNLYYHTEDYDCYYDDPWDVKVRISNITRWFYIDDLLPKGEK